MRTGVSNNSISDDVVLKEVYDSVDPQLMHKSLDDVADILEKELINAKKNRTYMKKDLMDSIAIAALILKAATIWKA